MNDAAELGDVPRSRVGDDLNDAPKAVSGRTRAILIVAGLALLIGAFAWLVRYETTGRFVQSTEDATLEADAVTVAPRVAGYVDQVLVAENQDVRVGQPLVRVDPRDYRARADQAQAQIAEAQAAADAARASISEQQATIAQAQAQYAAALVKAAYDRAEAARYEPLAASGAETRQQLASLRATAAQSDQNARALAAALEMQRRRIGSYRAQIRQGQAQAGAARAQLASAQVDVGATVLRATVNGRVGDRSVTSGQYVQAGARLMSIVPLDRLYVTANFKETQLALMRPGQPAEIEVDALDGTTLAGRVESVAPGTGAQFSLIPPSNATGNFTKIVQRVPVRLSIAAGPATRRLLVPGLSVRVSVDTIGAKGELDRVRIEQRRVDDRHR